jgi:hypothetical protein
MKSKNDRRSDSDELADTRPESRWMIAYHSWAGICLAALVQVLFAERSISLGAIPMVVAFLIGYFGSRALVSVISKSSVSRHWKTLWKWVLPLAYLPFAVLLAVAIGNAGNAA